MTQYTGTIFLAFEGLVSFLMQELVSRFGIKDIEKKTVMQGDLLFLQDTPVVFFAGHLPYFAKVVFLEPYETDFLSIGQAQKILRQMLKPQGRIFGYAFSFFRRTALIQQGLPYINKKQKDFMTAPDFLISLPHSSMGIFALESQNKMYFSPVTNSTLPLGELRLKEDHTTPPSRAYLKLQEALTYFCDFYKVTPPKKNQTVFDAGSSPGGWTWLLAKMGAKVFSIDRSPLTPTLMQQKNIDFMTGDAFSITPQNSTGFDWLFCDVACYPKRLFSWLIQWLKSGKVSFVICTIKLQGAVDYDLIKDFCAIKNSHIIHLFNNKHELTFFWKKP